MTRVLRSAAKKIQSSEVLSSKLSISKKSKTIKRRDKKVVEIKNENKKQIDIWNIDSILSNIFEYTDRKDLIEFSTVCKKWNNLTNPIIHKTIKLIRKRIIIYRGGIRFELTKNVDKDVVYCISNSAKHAHLIKEFKYDYIMNPQRAIEAFETFRFICILTIKECSMSQYQFLGMINPLTQLQELTINEIYIKNNIKNRSHNEAVQLPKSLKLRLHFIELSDNPELFIQTINSHRNLVEFKNYHESNYDLLEPFYKHYPSLLNFGFYNKLYSPQSLLTIFEHNPQLISLKLSLKHWNSELVGHISTYLINLEELKLSEYDNNGIDLFAKFTQPTKIKNLKLYCGRLSICSLNSILLNCPHLEELDLNSCTYYKQPNLIKFFDLSNPAKLKKLAINCAALSEGVLESILSKCPHISDLSINLSVEWKEVMRSNL